ncbi:MAG: 3-oxoacyl-[acyl-carrier-protein] synthase III C-terminal domain-containing protein [Myxococcales bacterium]|jgi:3-oxoacyl-[acyl-carrier-protein] synthase-3
MGARIEAVAGVVSGGGLLPRGARALADEAIARCLERAGEDPSAVGLLINAGIYREENLEEPALAAMIQQDVEMNPGGGVHPEHQGTFSFDLGHGGVGVVTSMHLIDGFIAGRSIERGVVVASDVDPGPRATPGYAFPRAGAALLLGPGDDREGLVEIATATFPEDASLFETRIRWHDELRRHVWSKPGAQAVELHEDPAYMRHAIERSEPVIAALLDRHGLKPGDLDLVLPSQQPRGYPAELAHVLSVPRERVIDLDGPARGAHTAGPLLALERAMESDTWRSARHVLFATVGAGLTVALALYRRAG